MRAEEDQEVKAENQMVRNMGRTGRVADVLYIPRCSPDALLVDDSIADRPKPRYGMT